MNESSDTSSGFGRGALQLAAANAAYVLAAYVTTTAVARILGPERFSGFGITMAWITVLTALLVKGLATSIARDMAAATRDSASPAAAWRAGALLGVYLSTGLALIGALAAFAFAQLVPGVDIGTQLVIGAFGALTFGVNAVLLAWPTGLRRYGRQALAQFAYGIARLALVLGGAWAWGINGAVIGYVLAPLLSSLTLLMPVPRGEHHTPTPEHWRSMLCSIAPISLVAIAISSYFVVDVFAISLSLGDQHREVGVYVAYGTLGHVAFFLLQSTSIAMVPAIAAAADAAARSRSIARILTDTVVLLAGPTLLLVTSGDAAARVIFGSEYDTRGLVVAPLAIATALVTWMSGMIAVDTALHRLRGTLVVALIGVAATALVAFAFAQPYEGRGVNDTSEIGHASDVAWAVAVAALATASTMASRFTRHHGTMVEWRRALLGVAVGALAAVPPFVASDDAVRMGAAAVCGVVWLAVVLRFGLVDARRNPEVA